MSWPLPLDGKGLLQRPLFWCAAALMAGLGIGHWCYWNLVSAWWPIGLALAGGVCGVAFWRRRVFAGAMSAFLCAGILLMGQVVGQLDGAFLVQAKPVEVRLCVLETRQVTEGYVVTGGYVQYGDDGEYLSGNVTWYSDTQLAVGQWLAGTADLRSPSGVRNPGVTSRVWRQYAQGVVYELGKPNLTPVEGETPVGLWRWVLRARTNRAVDGIFPQSRGLMRALLVGDDSALAQDEYDAFSAMGLIHVLVISGTHVSLVAMLIWVLWKKTKFVPRSFMPIVGCVLLILYMALTGFIAPAVRAGIMGCIVFLAPMFLRRNDPPTSLAASFILLVFLMPRSVLGIGFWMSFAAYLGAWAGMAWAAKLTRGRRRWVRWSTATVLATVGAQLLIAPLIAIIDGRLSLLSFFIYVILSPLLVGVIGLGLSLVVIGACAPSAIGLLGGMFAVADTAIDAGMGALVWCADNIPWLSMRFGAALPMGAMLVYYLGMCMWLPLATSRTAHRGAWTAACLVVALLLSIVTAYPLNNTACVRTMDVGQGQCVLVRTASGQTWLMDAGGEQRHGRDIVASLRALRVDHIDGVYLTHADADHVRLLPLIAENIPVARVVICENFDPDGNVEWPDGVPVERVADGTVVALDDTARLTIYHTSAKESAALLELEDLCLMFAGDMYFSAEAKLIERGVSVDAHLLQAGHHGAGGSTSPEFLRAVGPQAAMISCGRYNAYGHPAPEALERLRVAGVQVLRTDAMGSVAYRKRNGRWELWPLTPRAALS